MDRPTSNSWQSLLSLPGACLIGLCLSISACHTPTEQAPSPAEASSAQAVEVARSIVTGEHLRTELPENWLKIRDSKVANLHIAEYVPPDTTDDWVEKISIEAMQGTDLPDPLVFLQGMASDQAQFCKGFKDNPIFAGYENGYEAVVKLLECHVNTRTGKPIVTMLKAIRGNNSMYTISRFWRLTEPISNDGVLAIDPVALAAWSNALGDTFVCDESLPEHRCDKP